MRILGIGETCDLAAMYRRLARAGHEVRVFVGDAQAHDVFAGLLDRVDDWRAELDWLRAAGDEGVALFESADMGAWQDELRRAGFQVIGGSLYGDRLESDREFGQTALRDAGLQTAASRSFRRLDDAIEFVKKHPARYVYKLNGALAERTRSYVGVLDSGADMLAFLHLQQAALRRERDAPASDASAFVLMTHVHGVEVGVGAYFNGARFLTPALLDWEHKHFFPDEQGELTGEMGTIVTYRGAERLFERTLELMAPRLREAGHRGYINLNTIINEDGIWPLEFTSRFGYPGYAICEALHLEPWDAVFMKMLDPASLSLATRPGFACGVVLTVPPFPYSYGYEFLSKGAPICFRDGLGIDDHPSTHMCEVARAGDYLVTSGTTGYIGVATGAGPGIAEARSAAYAAADQVIVPNLRYRKDIGLRVQDSDLDRLASWGYLGR